MQYHTTHIVVAAVMAALAAMAAALPTKREAGAGPLDLDTVMNNTLCPIKVETDYDAQRVPKRLKVLRCGEDPRQWCAARGLPEGECCARSSGATRMQCVEVQDLVQVYYPAQDVTQQYRVSIGCTCMLQRSEGAQAAEPT